MPRPDSGTTMLAALRSGRHSIGVEIDREYCRRAARRLKAENDGLFSSAELLFERAEQESSGPSLCLDSELSHLRASRQRIG